MNARTIAIGDIHGCSAALDALLEAICPRPEDIIVTLGDYINRGSDSRGVLDRLIDLTGRCRLVAILGNHDQAEELRTWRMLTVAWRKQGFLLTLLVTMLLAVDGKADVRVEGVVIYDGRLPEPILVAEAGSSRQLIQIDPKTNGLKDAVVWLEGVRESAAQRKVADEPVVMDQRNFFFVPHVLAVKSGQIVEFHNSDVANHGVTASSLEPKNQFNVMIPLDRHHVHRFVTSKYPVAIGCPIHTAMAGWIYVFDHRFHAVTDKTGRFTLPPVPTGRYTLRVHHADGGLIKKENLVVEADRPLRLRIEFHDRDRKVAK